MVPLLSWAQPMATGKKTLGVFTNVGVAAGMSEIATDFQFGLSKSLGSWDVFADLHVSSYSESRVSSLTLVLGRDLLRLNDRHLKRHPYYLYPYAGIGMSHFSNPMITDSFLLRGDDMIHVSAGVQARMMFTRNFGLMSDVRFNQNMLVDYQLISTLNFNLGFILKIR
ncbi:MAG: hypothetical protein RL207_2027 [Bacteroidota bacterium]